MRLRTGYQKTIMLIQYRPYNQMDYQWHIWKMTFDHQRCEPGLRWVISNLLKISLKSVYSLHLCCCYIYLGHHTHLTYWSICSWPNCVPTVTSLKDMPFHITLLLKILSCVFIGIRIKVELHLGLPPLPNPTSPRTNLPTRFPPTQPISFMFLEHPKLFSVRALGLPLLSGWMPSLQFFTLLMFLHPSHLSSRHHLPQLPSCPVYVFHSTCNTQ